jgi:hypothetical protein
MQPRALCGVLFWLRQNEGVKLVKLLAICAFGLVVAWPIPADAGSQSAPVAKNLVATVKVKAALRAAHLRTLRLSDRSATRGPLPRSTYYGSYGSHRYALATFSHPRVGTTDQPELFSKVPGRPWRDHGDTGGCLTQGIIPPALIRLWHLRSYC